MTKIPNWKKVKHINREARKVTCLAKKKRIRDVGGSIIKKYRIPLYKKHVVKDNHDNKITTKLEPVTRKYKGHTRIRKRKIMDYKDFKNHYSIIPKHVIKKLNLTVSIVRLISKINGTTDLYEIANKYYKKLQSLKTKQDDSDQSDQQQNNTDTNPNINNDQGSQNNQIDPNNSDSNNSAKNKNQNSEHFDFSDPNSDNSGNGDPGKMPGN